MRESAVVRDSITRARLPRDVYVKDSTRVPRARSDGRATATITTTTYRAGSARTFRPAKAKLDAISVEYGLYRGKFWLPRANSATASAQVGFMRVPFQIDEKFTYEDVNGDFTLAPLPPPRARTASGDSTRRDSIGFDDDPMGDVTVNVSVGDEKKKPRTARDSAVADSVRLARMPANKRRQCATDSVWTRTETRYEGALRIAYAMPCDDKKLASSPALPPAYAADEELFDTKTRDDLLASLDLSLQPAFAPQRPTIRTGSDLWRYNRIEALSVGVLASQTLGAGYTLSATGRIGVADWHANGELSLARSNGQRTVTGTIYHRLNATNPEWAGALTLGPSIPALIYARDEGFYYRSYGVELGEKREQHSGSIEYKLFLEKEWTAGDSDVVNTFNVFGAFGDRQFIPNMQSEPSSVTGVSAAWLRAFGTDPAGFRLASVARVEAGTGTFSYARGSWEGTVSRPIKRVAAAVTGSIGSSVGDVPRQRNWFIGGVRTVRGQVAGTQDGDAFWLGRAEVGTRMGAVRPVLFYDVGWAGSRKTFGQTQAQRGTGAGVGFLDGLIRIDVARGLYPNKKWRTDIYFEAPL